MIPLSSSRPVLAARAAGTLVAALAILACSDAAAPLPAGPDVRIVPPGDSVFEGDTVRLTAQVFDEAGAPVAGAPVTWAVGDTTLARVVGDGVFALSRPGTVQITARSGIAAATYGLAIGRLVAQRVDLTPSSVTLGRTDRLPVVVRALGQGDRVIVGHAITFTSDDSAVAIVVGPPVLGSSGTGLLLGLGAGSTTIHATVDGVAGAAAISVVAVDTTFTLTGYNGAPTPVVVEADTVLVGGALAIFEFDADSGIVVLSGLLQKRYELEVRYSVYQVFPTGERELRAQIRAEHDQGVVTVGADGNLTLVSEVIGPYLAHTATLEADGYLVHFRIAGTDSYLDLRYSRVATAAGRP